MMLTCYSNLLSAEVVASRVKNLLVAMDTDNYTLPKRRTDYVSEHYTHAHGIT